MIDGGPPYLPASSPSLPPTGSAAGIPLPPGFDGAPGVPLTASAGRAPASRQRNWRRLILLPIAIVAIIIALVVRTNSSHGGLADLKVGDCIEQPDASGFHDITVIGCDKPHSQEVYAIGTATSTVDTGAGASSDPEIVRICRTDVDPRILAQLATTEGAQAGFLIDSSKKGRLVCTAITPSRTGSIVAAAQVIATS
jgi:hypothetical protein